MRHAQYTWILLSLAAIAVRAQDARPQGRPVHQAPDKDGVYYAGPEVTAPRLLNTVYVPFPEDTPARDIQGMTVLAMVIDANGTPTHIQVLHSHGEPFDQLLAERIGLFRAFLLLEIRPVEIGLE